jgi:hemoglobin/transferrin/lactoferrin receptor protein
MNSNKIIPLLFFYCWNLTLLLGQADSLAIQLDELTWKDIQQDNNIEINNQVSSASRSLKSIRELPFSIYVISGAEIRKNGYITLPDALKMLPGIRVSQPGSAIDGELFMMRGLIGNTYVKILINGIPIKPYMVNGMPIGAQLPIQQAERIEVTYGPAAALYGSDATSGIVNIVMRESDRPIFTEASVHVGTNAYSSLNLVLGGKIGKGKNVLKFSIFGLNTRSSDQNIVYDEDLIFNPAQYNADSQLLNSLENSGNYSGTAEEPNIQDLPHQSYSFGFDASYKVFNVSFKTMHRQDHSALGLNPLTISYANPLTFRGEDITEFNIRAKQNYKNWGFQSIIGTLSYEMDNRSSAIYLKPALAFALDSLAKRAPNPEMLLQQINDTYFDRTRFSYSNSLELYAEQTFNFTVFKQGELTTGLRIQVGNGEPFIDFQPNPVNSSEVLTGNLEKIFTDASYTELSSFGQLFLPFKKWNILLSAQYLLRKNADYVKEIRAFNPRIAFLYKARKNLFLRASYSTAFKTPSPYLSATTYTVRERNLGRLVTGLSPLDAEETFSYEAGIRWLITPKAELDLSAYFNKTKDFVAYDILPFILPDNELSLTLGYFNSENTIAQIGGVQSRLILRDLVPKIHLNMELSLAFSKGKEDFLSSVSGVFGDRIKGINSIRAYPAFIGQARMNFSLTDKIQFTLDHLLLSKSTTRNTALIEIQGGGDEDLIKNDGFYTLDLMANYQVTPNFKLYIKGYNILGKEYAGIDAYSDPNVLLYNPQNLFTYRVGVNYSLN